MSHGIASRAIALSLLCAGLFLTAPNRASAQDPNHWQVVELHGAATVMRAGVAPVSLSDKVELQGGDQIRTELGGRVILRHGGDTVLIAPNSQVAIPATDTGLFTRLFQTFGTVLVNVQKRPDPHFEVRTPFLAAIVKGTTFTVSADAVSSAVQVVEGVVNVVDSAQRQSVTVTAGQTARINSRSGEGLHVDGPRRNAPDSGTAQHAETHASAAPGASAADGSRRISQPIGLKPVDAVKASGGLLRNDDGHGAGRAAAAHGTERSALTRQADNANGNSANGAAGPGAAASHAPAGLAALLHSGSSSADGNAGARVALGGGNGNAGGNGNGNAGGNGNGNAGSNGNGNAGGNGNGNAGGNGNGNAGGNGNGNAGGNANGHGHP